MRILVFKPNFEGMSSYKNGDMEVLTVTPTLINSDSIRGYQPDFVIVSKELNTEEQKAALNYAYKVTDYKEGKLQKVALL